MCLQDGEVVGTDGSLPPALPSLSALSTCPSGAPNYCIDLDDLPLAPTSVSTSVPTSAAAFRSHILLLPAATASVPAL